MRTIRAILNHILFQFESEVVRSQNHGTGGTQFKEETDWGFEISNYDEGTKEPKWGIITHVGPEVKDDILPGMRVLIESLKWTSSIKVDGIDYWRTDGDQIMLIDETVTPTT